MHLLRGLTLWLLIVSAAWAQFDVPGLNTGFRQRAVRARLVLSHEAAKPGDTVMAGIELTHNVGWHTYWRNGGDSGIPTEINWALPSGISVGENQWPVPEKLIDRTIGEQITYVYHGRTVLLVPLKIAPHAPTGTQEVRALVTWLECSATKCVPGSNLVSAMLTIGAESKPSGETNFFTEAASKLPSKDLPGAVRARWEGSDAAARSLLIEWQANAKSPDFFPFTNALATISNRTEVVATSPTNVILRKLVAKTGDRWPSEIAGLLVREENGTPSGYEVSLKLADAGSGVAPSSFVGQSQSLWLWLVYAFLGGLILNIMPCVLPVIALKILGFVNQSQEHPRRVRMLGLLYTLGVIASFLVFAGIVIGVKAAGQKAGWGMQFSSPFFVVGLTVIVTLVALNLFGIFEVTISGRAMGAASEAAGRHGSAGAFMNGVLATVLATPCTAPFFGAALGFAFAQPPRIIVLVFVIAALGLASPYLLLSWNPHWLKFLPKPGVWMERFKVAMGFPMLATAVWLFSLSTTFYGERSWWLTVFLVFVGAAVWVFGTFVQHGTKHRGLALLIVAVLLATGYVWALERKLLWRSPDSGSGHTPTLALAPKGFAWQRWSEEAVNKARGAGHPVVVDFTAKWCQTCNIQVKPGFESKAVIDKLKSIDAVALVADWTRYAQEITQELERFGRSGVPLVVVYPADVNKPPLVLSEPLPFTPYGPTILEALEKVGE
jgi:thiol:disulfide interchange protein